MKCIYVVVNCIYHWIYLKCRKSGKTEDLVTLLLFIIEVRTDNWIKPLNHYYLFNKVMGFIKGVVQSSINVFIKWPCNKCNNVWLVGQYRLIMSLQPKITLADRPAIHYGIRTARQWNIGYRPISSGIPGIMNLIIILISGKGIIMTF